MLAVEAATEADAIARVVASGGIVVELIQSRVRSRAGGGDFSLLLFAQELLSLLSAGLNLTEAMATLLAKETGASSKAILQGIQQALNEGKRFSQALELYPAVFPEMFVASVRASEKTGGMVEALSRYIAYALQFDAVRKRLISASIYPAILLTVGSLPQEGNDLFIGESLPHVQSPFWGNWNLKSGTTQIERRRLFHLD